MMRTLYRLRAQKDGELTTVDSSTGMDFNAVNYSRFKYGDSAIATTYAYQLITVLERMHDITPTDVLMVCGSAYHNVPTAAVSIALAFMDQLARFGRTAYYFRTHCNPYTRDYGALPLNERRALVENNHLHVTKGIGKALIGAKIIAIDDMRVTGVHEDALSRLFDYHRAQVVTFCYVAVLPQAQGKKNPLIEDRINHVHVTGLEPLAAMISSNPRRFCPNARTCKFILGALNDERQAFARMIPQESLHNLLASMVADGYHEVPEYREAFLSLFSISRVRAQRIKT